jgi:simple sugar transport system ATP-binding protein
VGDRQRVEIVKVLYRGARILILDEPTAVLVPQEVDDLFANLHELTSEGLTVVFISHKLDEVRKVADSITVIRRGETVGTVDPRSVTSRQLAELMVGSELPIPELRDSTVTDRVVLDISGLIMGLQRTDAGRISYAGTDITHWSTRRRREAGIAYIPEDRHRHGLVLEGALWENRMLGHQTQQPNARGPWIDRRGAKRDTTRIVLEYDVRTPGINVPAAALSGGNQQKLIVGREMSGEPKLLIAAHPTRGIDVGAQAAIWEYLRHARAAGLAVLLISADLEELIGMSDTLHVVLRGRLVAQVDPSGVTPEELGSAMTGAEAAS